jgi:polyphosphate kinase 2 (PPK2 family)
MGGAIRRVTQSIDAREYQVIPIGAPNDEEGQYPYLWRFWRHLPRSGRLRVFDRSWYGRVLVERVEAFATEAEWRRAYAEINDFEAQLVEHGSVVIKFWLHVSPKEQMRRFKQRKKVPYKRWKLNEEDWRNRDRWTDYEIAVNDMVEHTSTAAAPWVLVEGEDKRWARVRVIEALADHLERRLGVAAPVGNEEPPANGSGA